MRDSLSSLREKERALQPPTLFLVPLSPTAASSSLLPHPSLLLFLSPYYIWLSVVETLVLKRDVLPPPQNFWTFVTQIWFSDLGSLALRSDQPWRQIHGLLCGSGGAALFAVVSTSGSVVSINVAVNFGVIFMFCCSWGYRRGGLETNLTFGNICTKWLLSE